MKLSRGLGITTRFVGTDANGTESGGVLSGANFLGLKWTYALGAVYAPILIRLCAMSEATVERAYIIFVAKI